MAVRESPPLLRRLIGQRLKDRRVARGEAAATVAAATDINASVLSRIENGRRPPPIPYVEKLCDYYAIDDSEKALLLEMAKASRESGWWEKYPKLPQAAVDYISWESAAATIENFEVSMIPGLLQTREYANELVTRHLPEYTDQEVRATVDTRMKRKQVLDRPSLTKFHAIIDAVVFERPIGSEKIMREQLQSLIEATRNYKVILQVVPKNVGAYKGMRGGFSILGFTDDDERTEILYSEGAFVMNYQDAQPDLDEAHQVFQALKDVAVGPHESIALIREKITDYT
ncbi:helix-turn-helix transcriptional regulator [Actinoplanes sp. NPDC026670]|uniref:helix-turn-helix domain-containing protein n=1 Tax=Actinoplanes sp. NPDC026670 TaxID=3154700 RepID=UPI0033F1556B